MRFLKIGPSEASLALRLPSGIYKPGHQVFIRLPPTFSYHWSHDRRFYDRVSLAELEPHVHSMGLVRLFSASSLAYFLALVAYRTCRSQRGHEFKVSWSSKFDQHLSSNQKLVP